MHLMTSRWGPKKSLDGLRPKNKYINFFGENLICGLFSWVKWVKKIANQLLKSKYLCTKVRLLKSLPSVNNISSTKQKIAWWNFIIIFNFIVYFSSSAVDFMVVFALWCSLLGYTRKTTYQITYTLRLECPGLWTL